MLISPPAPVVETQMASLTEYTLRELRFHNSPALTETVRIVLRQVEHPSANLGGSGPPGHSG